MAHYQIQPVTEKNVGAIPGLLYSVYGYTYNYPWMYDPDRIVKASSSGEIIFFLAVDERDQAKGSLGLCFPYPTRSVGFFSTLLIDPDIRGMESGFIFRDLAKEVQKKAYELAVKDKLRVILSSETMVHQLSQRLIKNFGFVNTGIFLAWCPVWTDRLRASQFPGSAQRGSTPKTLRTFRERRSEAVSLLPFLPLFKPYTVCLPKRYDRLIRTIYEALQLPVRFSEPGPAEGTTNMDCSIDYPRSLATIDIIKLGRDALQSTLERFDHFRNGLLDLIHIFIPMCQGDINPVVDALAGRGCKYCTIVPHYRDGDVLVLQYLNGFECNVTEDQLHTPMARMIFKNL